MEANRSGIDMDCKGACVVLVAAATTTCLFLGVMSDGIEPTVREMLPPTSWSIGSALLLLACVLQVSVAMEWVRGARGTSTRKFLVGMRDAIARRRRAAGAGNVSLLGGAKRGWPAAAQGGGKGDNGETIVSGARQNGGVRFEYAVCARQGHFTRIHPDGAEIILPKPMQDSFVVASVEETSGDSGEEAFMLGVFDGHGQNGYQVSSMVSRVMVAELVRRRSELSTRTSSLTHDPRHMALRDAFVQTNLAVAASDVDHSFSGTTACVAYVDGENVSVANCGDSRCVLGYIGVGGRWRAKELSFDHKPDNYEETKRIEAAGGLVAPAPMYPDGPYRVWNGQGTGPGLAMSRALGDGVAQTVGVSPEPDVIDHHVDMSRDRMLIVCSDGVWEFISSQEAVEIAGQCQTAKEAAETLQAEARKRWEQEEGGYCDDITALCVFLR